MHSNSELNSFLSPVTHISIKSVSQTRDLGAIMESHLSFFLTTNPSTAAAYFTLQTSFKPVILSTCMTSMLTQVIVAIQWSSS